MNLIEILEVETVVWARDENTSLMNGDFDTRFSEANALPHLLAEGWEIEMATGGENAYFVLRKK